MIVRRYQGKTPEEAAFKAREDLGPQLVILLTKPLGDGSGILRYEVVAAIDAADTGLYEETEIGESRSLSRESNPARLRYAPPLARAASDKRITKDDTSYRPTTFAGVNTAISPGPSVAFKPSRTTPERDDPDESSSASSAVLHIRKQVASDAYRAISSATENMSRKSTLPVGQMLSDILLEQEVESEIAETLLQEVETMLAQSGGTDSRQSRDALRQALEKFVRISGGIRLDDSSTGSGRSLPTVIAMVGPTGVGKTTTIAKLAAFYHLEEHRKVALLSADTYRIGAPEQLRTYANILGIPMETVATPPALEQAMQKYRSYDLVFVDTPGRSPQNKVQIQELRSLLKVAAPTEVYLMVSSTTKPKDLWEISRGFHPLNPNRLVFTKLDETSSYGSILNFAYHLRLPLAYFTTGQTVPDDLETVTFDRLTQLLLPKRQPFYA